MLSGRDEMKVCSWCGQLEGIEAYDAELWSIYHRLDDGGRKYIEPIVFTGDDFYEMGGDEDAYEVMNITMEKNMVERGLCGECGRPDLRGITPDQIMSEEDAQDLHDMYAEMRAEQRMGA